ncbi:molybdopterin-guanine dinucleotide biosynthesis protein B [Thermodesulfobacteriota bacterium]
MKNSADYIKRGTGQPPLVLIVGNSGSGKTSLLVRLVPELKKRGLRIGTIKHHHRDFEIDYPGKDSWRHKRAGAERTMISSPNRIGIVMDADHDHTLDELVPFFSGMDIIIAEGYKGENRPKVEIFRSEVNDKPICLKDHNLIAMMTYQDIDLEVPRFVPDDVKGLADFLSGFFKLQRSVL